MKKKEKIMSENVMNNSLLNSVDNVASKMYSNLKALVGLYNTSRNEIINDIYNMFVWDKYFNTIFEYYRLCNDVLGRVDIIRHGEDSKPNDITIAPGDRDVDRYLISNITNNIGKFEYRNDVTGNEKMIRYTSTKRFKLNIGLPSELMIYGNLDEIEKDLFVNCLYPNSNSPGKWNENFVEFDRSARSLIFSKYPVFVNFIAQLIQFGRDNIDEDTTDIRLTDTILRYKYIDPNKPVFTDDEKNPKSNSSINLHGDIIDYILEDISNAVNARIQGDGIGIKLSTDTPPRYTTEGAFSYKRPLRLNVSIQSTIIDDGNDSPFDVFSANFAKDTNKTYRFY